MKRIFKKLVIVVLCCALSVMCIPNETEQVIALEDVISVDDIDIDYEMKQIESIERYRNMLASFNIESKIRTNEGQVYDDNYGGAYLDDNAELVVLLVKRDARSISEIQTYAKSESIKTQECKYSYNELLSVIHAVNNNLEYFRENGIIIFKMNEDVYNNRVCIGVVDLTESKEKMIRKITNSECVYIYNAEAEVKPASGLDIKGGDKVVSDENGHWATIGFCALKNGREGFVISGHLGDHAGERMKVSSTVIGSVTHSAYYTGTNADAAFVLKDSGVNTTSMINVYQCRYVATDSSYYPVGTRVHKYGACTEQTYGEVVHNEVTFVTDGTYACNQTETTMEVYYGDSGGPVYTIGSIVNGKITCRLVGIVVGKVNDYGDWYYFSYFTKYKYIVQELGLTAIVAQ